jgi:hypothetical protein
MTETGFANLIIAIFRLTAQDLRYGNAKSKAEANAFLESQWFEDLCEVFYTDPKVIRHRIRTSPVSWREVYE